MASYFIQNDVSVLKGADGKFPLTIVYDAGQTAKVEFRFENGFYQWYKNDEHIEEMDVYHLLMIIENSYSTNAYRNKETGEIILKDWKRR